jgi:hypothetical protein
MIRDGVMAGPIQDPLELLPASLNVGVCIDDDPQPLQVGPRLDAHGEPREQRLDSSLITNRELRLKLATIEDGQEDRLIIRTLDDK